MHHQPTGRNTFGEALLAMVALGGLIALAYRGHVNSWSDIWLYSQMLIVIVIFYAVILLIRAIFTFMVGNDSFWWQQYEMENRKHWENHANKE